LRFRHRPLVPFFVGFDIGGIVEDVDRLRKFRLRRRIAT